ncbi:MAG TPA: preprotein translocase subunit SecE [Planctomycetaceae bacterium]|nr:preprotein translocase subunit SecE [Planctomycetaceae bacterium]
MATTKSKGEHTLMSEMFAAGLYKRNQGRRVRQWTAVAIALLFVLGANALYQQLLTSIKNNSIVLGIAIGIGAVGCWFAYRVVNYPRFADFLISVQAEMDKVTWVGWKELYRSTIVVIVCMAVICALLSIYDVIWTYLFELVGFLQI